MNSSTDPDFTHRSIIERIVRPPITDLPFWIIQATVLVIVGVHYFVDLHPSLVNSSLPTGVPVAVLVIPIGYAALRYGLAGSAATTIWTLILWLPDLMLPHDEGHAGDDLLNFAIIILVAVIFGRRIETERLTQQRIDEAAARTLAIEAGYRRLFESNRSPIVVIDERGVVTDANPAATGLLGAAVVGRAMAAVLDEDLDIGSLSGRVLSLAGGHDYRLDVVTLLLDASAPRRQITFEDITEERNEERRARQFAQQVIQVEEDQRRRLARELHDEPLQLFLHLARRLETLGNTGGVPETVATGLAETRNQALDAAARLRSLARDLRPPALDQLGLVAALSSLVADVDDEGSESTQLSVQGSPTRLSSDVELGAFRIVQESLRNAQRHANAHHLRVNVEFQEAALHVTIVDDGTGFDQRRALRSEGESPSLGIVGMRERARLLGGSLTVRSTAGVGTVVEATLPFETRPTVANGTGSVPRVS